MEGRDRKREGWELIGRRRRRRRFDPPSVFPFFYDRIDRRRIGLKESNTRLGLNRVHY